MKTKKAPGPSFFRKMLLGFIPFPIIISDFLHEHNESGRVKYLFLEEPDLPENFSEHFFPKDGFFYRDRRLVRSGLIVRNNDEETSEKFYQSFINWHDYGSINQKRFRFIPCENIEFTPLAGKRPVYLVIWASESTFFEKILGKNILSGREEFLDSFAEKARDILNKRPWRRWRSFKYICSSNGMGNGFARIQLHITNSRFRAVVISIPDSSGESIPVFFDRLYNAKDIIAEHKSMLSAANHSSMKSLSLDLKKNGRYSLLAKNILILHYSASQRKWNRPEDQILDTVNFIQKDGILKRGDRLILSSGEHDNEITPFLFDTDKFMDDWIFYSPGNEDSSRAIFLMRD